MRQYRDAIARIESGGRYNAIGPNNPRMGRALGKYQMMEANIGPWSQEALGRPVSADEFLANPQIQDAIFDHKFGGYVKQFGPEGAAQAWFAGPGGVGKTDRKDVLGTDVGSYGRKFMAGLGASPYADMPDGPKGQEVYTPPPDQTMVASTGQGPSGSIDPNALQDPDENKGLLGFFKALEQYPDAQPARMGQMGDARQSSGGLLELLGAGGNPYASFARKQRGILG